MKKDYWLPAALTNDMLVAELLLRLKHSSDSDSPETRKAVTTIVPPLWGHRKNRSKSAAPTAAVVKEHRLSPTTHLSWSGGGASTSDGPSDLSSGSRSVKVNEGASISSHHNLDQNPRNKMRKMELCNVKGEPVGPQRGFVLPDLNMTPIEEDLSMMMV